MGLRYVTSQTLKCNFYCSADVNARDNFKWTPMHHACHAGQLDLVRLLLDSGAEMESVALNGGTPLMRAIESSSFDVVTFLIERGARMQIENKKGICFAGAALPLRGQNCEV